jgi:hypothetical protein
MTRAVQIYAAVHFAIIGLSHVAVPLAWVELFKLFRAQGRPGVFAHGFLGLFFGAVIVAWHDVWSWPDVVLTIVGWLYVIKAASCFLTPSLQSASLARVSPQRALELRAAGAAYLLVALFLAWRLVE